MVNVIKNFFFQDQQELAEKFFNKYESYFPQDAKVTDYKPDPKPLPNLPSSSSSSTTEQKLSQTLSSSTEIERKKITSKKVPDENHYAQCIETAINEKRFEFASWTFDAAKKDGYFSSYQNIFHYYPNKNKKPLQLNPNLSSSSSSSSSSITSLSTTFSHRKL